MSMLRFEHGFVEGLFASDDIALGLLDSDLRYVSVNQKLAEINGRSASEHVGKSVREVLPDFADFVEPLLEKVISSRQPLVDLEISGPTPTDPNADRHFRGSYFPILDGDEVIGVGAIVLEVTERARSERALAEQAHRVFDNIVQSLSVAKLSLEEGESDKALESVTVALSEAKEIATDVLTSELLRQPDVT
ncbi:MAG: PAS domain-containing protein [Actinobacteria bacterium]|nr:PAS domain-containing protein [Actinomycetota bacterium]